MLDGLGRELAAAARMGAIAILATLGACTPKVACAQTCLGCILNQATLQSGAQFNVSSATVQGTLTVGKITVSTITAPTISAGVFTGSGTFLTNLNASQLTTGTASTSVVLGSYPGITGLGTVATGVWHGTALATQYGGTGQNFVTISTGSLPYFSALGTMAALAPAGSGVLMTQGATLPPAWTTSPAITGANVTAIPLANLSSGNLPTNIAVSTNSIALVNAASVSGNISGGASFLTVALPVSNLAGGTLPTSNACSSVTAQVGLQPATMGGPSQLLQVKFGYDGRISTASQYNLTISSSQLSPGPLPSGITISAYQITGGTLATNVIASSIAASGVAVGTYGGPTQTLSEKILIDGRISSVTAQNIAIAPSQINSGTLPSNVLVPAANIQAGPLGASVIASSVASSGLAPGTYGGPGIALALVFNGPDGRVSSLTQNPIPGVSTYTALTNVDNNWNFEQTFGASVTINTNLVAQNMNTFQLQANNVITQTLVASAISTYSIISSSGIQIVSGGITWPNGTVSTTAVTAASNALPHIVDINSPVVTTTMTVQGNAFSVGNLLSIDGSQNFKIGANTVSGGSSVGGGLSNTSSGGNSFIGAGQSNQATSGYSFVGAGSSNQATNGDAFVGAGSSNVAGGGSSFVGAGSTNEAYQGGDFVGAGNNNGADGFGDPAVVGGGQSNTAYGEYSSILGGQSNSITANNGDWGFIGGGLSNTVSGHYGAISGGDGNEAAGAYTFVGGGSGVEALSDYSAIGGGVGNTIYVDPASSSNASFIGGGNNNIISGLVSAIGGGTNNNIVSGENNFIGGGYGNTANSTYSFVGGGLDNQATGSYSSVSGGATNVATGNLSTIPGGENNSASGGYSFAAGVDANSNANGDFTWADSQGITLKNNTTDQFLVRSQGGVEFLSSSFTLLNATGSSQLFYVSASSAQFGVQLFDQFGNKYATTSVSGSANGWTLNGSAIAANVGANVTIPSTVTIQGNAFSIGGSSFTVYGGSATLSYKITIGSLESTNAIKIDSTTNIDNESSVNPPAEGGSASATQFSVCIATVSLTTYGSAVRISFDGNARNNSSGDECDLYILQDSAFINLGTNINPISRITSPAGGQYFHMSWDNFIMPNNPSAGAHSYCWGISTNGAGNCSIDQVMFSVSEIR